MIFLTTTAIEIDEELLNRCLVLTVDEDREQTQAIHEMQREAQTLEGSVGTTGARRHSEAAPQRAAALAAAPSSTIPCTPSLTFLDDQTRTRRDHMKYLTLIHAIALLAPVSAPGEDATRGTARRSSTSRPRTTT